MFQSLLFWIWGSDLKWYVQSFPPGCFNPCCSGYGAQTTVVLCSETEILSFNPCCSGYGAQTTNSHLSPPHDIRFNPCCSGYGAQTRRIGRLQILPAAFQSLLFWIWGSDSHCQLPSRLPMQVSILVVLDMGLRPSMDTEGCILLGKFQSLLFWIWGSDFNQRLCQHATERFNPCCSGYGAQTAIKIMSNNSGSGFNPCCSGYGAQTVHICGVPGAVMVSILVVLDMGLRLSARIRIMITPSRFNPCCSGYGAQTLRSLFGRTQTICFNPCCSGYGAQTPLPRLIL